VAQARAILVSAVTGMSFYCVKQKLKILIKNIDLK
jgi:hypothetical protein